MCYLEVLDQTIEITDGQILLNNLQKLALIILLFDGIRKGGCVNGYWLFDQEYYKSLSSKLNLWCKECAPYNMLPLYYYNLEFEENYLAHIMRQLYQEAFLLKKSDCYACFIREANIDKHITCQSINNTSIYLSRALYSCDLPDDIKLGLKLVYRDFFF